MVPLKQEYRHWASVSWGDSVVTSLELYSMDFLLRVT
jgi:hypothetical protein